MQQHEKGQQNEKGFTLIELLIVIVILGILAAVVVFAVGGITGDSEINACEAEKRAVQTAVEAYRIDNGNYPADLASIVGIFDNAYLRSDPAHWDLATGVSAGSGSLVKLPSAPAQCD